jgi:two-component system heavy metal sensor histidine kinase CusS
MNFDSNTNVVEVAIKRLRAKIDAPSSRSCCIPSAAWATCWSRAPPPMPPMSEPAAKPVKKRRLPLRQSITARLVLMSAASALLIFAVAGVALYTVLKGELLRHERDALFTTLNDISYQIERAGNTERWARVQLKLSTLSQADQHVFFWIASDDARYTYGDLTRLSPSAINHADGKLVGRLHLPGRAYPLHIMTRTLPPFEDRPEVRVTVGVDGALTSRCAAPSCWPPPFPRCWASCWRSSPATGLPVPGWRRCVACRRGPRAFRRASCRPACRWKPCPKNCRYWPMPSTVR